jgi:putative flippase GtrA
MISRKTAVRLFRYILTGGSAAVIDVSLCTWLVALGQPLLLASCMSFCVAAVVNYALASFFVFGHPLSLRQLGLFVAVALLGMGINVGVTLVAASTIPFGAILLHLTDAMGLPADIARATAVAPAKICGIGVAFLFNFYLNSTIVFRDRSEPVGAGPA